MIEDRVAWTAANFLAPKFLHAPEVDLLGARRSAFRLVANLRSAHIERIADRGLDAMRSVPVTVSDNPLTPMRQDFFEVLIDKGRLAGSAAASIRRAPSRAIMVSGSLTDPS